MFPASIQILSLVVLQGQKTVVLSPFADPAWLLFLSDHHGSQDLGVLNHYKRDHLPLILGCSKIYACRQPFLFELNSYKSRQVGHGICFKHLSLFQDLN